MNKKFLVASEGLDTQIITISEFGSYEIDIAIFGTGVGNNPELTFTGLDDSGIFEIGSFSTSTTEKKIQLLSLNGLKTMHLGGQMI